MGRANLLVTEESWGLIEPETKNASAFVVLRLSIPSCAVFACIVTWMCACMCALAQV